MELSTKELTVLISDDWKRLQEALDKKETILKDTIDGTIDSKKETPIMVKGLNFGYLVKILECKTSSNKTKIKYQVMRMLESKEICKYFMEK